jgi:hypothetical protein
VSAAGTGQAVTTSGTSEPLAVTGDETAALLLVVVAFLALGAVAIGVGRRPSTRA